MDQRTPTGSVVLLDNLATRRNRSGCRVDSYRSSRRCCHLSVVCSGCRRGSCPVMGVTLMDISALHPYRWNLVFELLSLDCVVPLYAEMGLAIDDEPRFVHILRRLITEKRKTYAHFDNADLSFATEVMRDIEDEFG